MLLAFLSRRLRSWLLLTLLLPLGGRLLQVLGVRVGARSPRAGAALTRAGDLARVPADRRARRRGPGRSSAPR